MVSSLITITCLTLQASGVTAGKFTLSGQPVASLRTKPFPLGLHPAGDADLTLALPTHRGKLVVGGAYDWSKRPDMLTEVRCDLELPMPTGFTAGVVLKLDPVAPETTAVATARLAHGKCSAEWEVDTSAPTPRNVKFAFRDLLPGLSQLRPAWQREKGLSVRAFSLGVDANLLDDRLTATSSLSVGARPSLRMQTMKGCLPRDATLTLTPLLGERGRDASLVARAPLTLRWLPGSLVAATYTTQAAKRLDITAELKVCGGVFVPKLRIPLNKPHKLKLSTISQRFSF